MNNYVARLLPVLFFLFLSGYCEAQTIITYAGGGVSFSEGIPATTANLYYPSDIITDHAGNKYIAELGGNKIRKVDAAGIITTFAGTGLPDTVGDGGPATAAGLYNPFDIALDTGGNFYITDNQNNKIRKVNTAGVISTICGWSAGGFSGDGGPATSAQISAPQGIVADRAGNLYFADYGNFRVRRIDAAGIITTVAGGGSLTGDGVPATAALIYPNDVAIDRFGNLFITTNANVKKVSGGIITTVGGTTTAGGGAGDGGPATDAYLFMPYGIVVDSMGNIYFSDTYNHRVRQIDRWGIINTVAGTIPGYSGDGGPATAAALYYPYGVALDDDGNLFIADHTNHVIREVFCMAPPPISEITGATSVCVGDTIMLADSLAGGRWISGFALRATIDGAGVVTGVLSGPVNILYQKTNSCTTVTAVKSITVNPLPNAGTVTDADLMCRDSTYTVVSTAVGGVWGNTGSAVTVSSAGVVSAVAWGIDTITYTVTNLCGMAVATFPVRVIVCGPDEVHAAPGVANAIFEISPNPNKGTFTINLVSVTEEHLTVVITNTVGRKVKELKGVTNKETEITLEVPPGVYFVNAVTGHGRYVSKVVVE
jgi:sugar lactone lactonase YvrE